MIYSATQPYANFYKGFPLHRKAHLVEIGKIGANENSKKFWINDGVESKMIFISNTIPDGWNKGRYNAFSGNRGKALGRNHYNDGINSYMLYPDDPKCKTLTKGRLKFN